MKTLEATFCIVTPMFLGGSKPTDGQAELREPSLKGALRYWYRAIDPEYRSHEARIFGGSGKGQGQSMFLLKITGQRKESNEWDDEGRNGIRYFSFPFKMNQNRKYINCNGSFLLKFIFKKSIAGEDRKRILAALWLMGHIGGLGSRSRRGFGTIVLKSIKTDEPWKELAELPLASERNTIDQWVEIFQLGLTSIKRWFPSMSQDDHTILGPQSKFRLINAPRKNWKDSLDFIGNNMREFRNRHNLKDYLSDYYKVRAHICAVDLNAAAEGAGKKDPIIPRKLTTAPDRTVFGLPLTFRSNSLKYQITGKDGRSKNRSRNVTFEGEANTHGRSASRIHIRVVQIGADYYPLVVRLDGPLLSHNERIRDKYGVYDVPSDKILEEYWNNLPNGQEVSWATI